MTLETSGAEDIFDRHAGFRADPNRQDELWAELVDMFRELGVDAVPFEEQERLYHRIYETRRLGDGPPAAWRPTAATVEHANLTRLMRKVGAANYRELHAWSARERAAFWETAAAAVGVQFQVPPRRVLDEAQGAEDARWFVGAKLNAAEACFRAPPQQVAIVHRRDGETTLQRITYGELKTLTDRVTAGLKKTGFGSGDAIAIYMPMTPQCVAAYLGIVQAGCAVVSIADSFAPPEVATRLKIADAKGIITVDSFARAGKRVELYKKVQQARASGSALRAIVIPAEGKRPALEGDDITWDEFLADPALAKTVAMDPEDKTNILFSSGTTGEPKAIPWTHLTPIKAAVDGHYHQDIHTDDVVAWPTNIGWMMGPWLIYATFYNQACMAIYDGAPTSADFCRFVAQARVSMLGLVPALVRRWRETEATKGCDWSAVRVFSSTGEASNVPDYLWLMSRTGYRAPVIEYCGGTEIGGGHITGTVLQPASPATFTTPALGLDFVVLDEEGKAVQPGGMGELFLVPPSVGLSNRLLNRDHHDVYHKGTPKGPKGETLRRHGDEIQRLGGGAWQAQGRADDTMNLGGIKVSSVELERIMDQDERVKETAAIGVPPARGGAERLVVYCVAASKAPDKATLQAALQERIKAELNPLFKIHDLVFIEALPRTASNKVMRRELRAEYQGRAPT